MMATRLPSLNGLRAFEAVARHLSFQKAADELNLTPSALSYQVRVLEETLGERLFIRLNRAIALTEAGDRMAPLLSRAFETMAEAVGTLVPSTPDDVLVVSTGPALAAKWLAPRVYRFVDAHPDLELRISASLKLADFRADAVDVGLRFGAGRYEGLVVEPLLDDSVTPMAAPGLVERLGLRTPADIARAPLLFDESMTALPGAPTWPDWFRSVGLDASTIAKGLRFSHADHAIDAAVEEAGVILGRMTLTRADRRLRRLVAPFPDHVLATNHAYYLVCLPAVRQHPKIERFLEWLRAEIATDIASDPLARPLPA